MHNRKTVVHASTGYNVEFNVYLLGVVTCDLLVKGNTWSRDLTRFLERNMEPHSWYEICRDMTPACVATYRRLVTQSKKNEEEVELWVVGD